MIKSSILSSSTFLKEDSRNWAKVWPSMPSSGGANVSTFSLAARGTEDINSYRHGLSTLSAGTGLLLSRTACVSLAVSAASVVLRFCPEESRYSIAKESGRSTNRK